jgi:hypothetical protein
MRVHVVVLALSAALLTASCLQGPESPPETESRAQRSSGPEPIGEARQEASGPRYGSRDFPFVVEAKDDGEGKGGGWQVAHHSSAFKVVEWPLDVYRWECHLEIGMPLRSEMEGPISKSRAALITAEVANDVVFPLLDRGKWEGLGALFCIDLKNEMNERFRSQYRGYGARVEKWQ